MKHAIFYSAVLVLLVGLSGCSDSASKTAAKGGDDPTIANEHANHENADHNGPGDHMTDMEKMKAELAKLSPEDAASAMKQHLCPVTDEMLGVMGPPIKVDVNGKEVWICCEGCRDKLLENPDEYLAKLEQK